MFSASTRLDPLTVLIRGLKTDGIWDRIEWLSVARAAEAQSLTNLKNAADVAVNVNSAPFAPFRGFNTQPGPPANRRRINTNKLFGGLMSPNSIHLWLYETQYTSPVSPSVAHLMGTFEGVSGFDDNYFIDNGNGTISGVSGSQSSAVAAVPPTGFVGYSRSSSTSLEMRINAATSIQAAANTGTVFNSLNAIVGGIPLGGDVLMQQPMRVQGWGWGQGLTSTQLGNLRARIQTYMTSIGAQA